MERHDNIAPRSVVDNLMGESLQLHRDHLLEDVQQERPVFVGYRSYMNYVVEAIVVLLLIAGALVARRQRFLYCCGFLVCLRHVDSPWIWFRTQRSLHHDSPLGVCHSYSGRLSFAPYERCFAAFYGCRACLMDVGVQCHYFGRLSYMTLIYVNKLCEFVRKNEDYVANYLQIR